MIIMIKIMRACGTEILLTPLNFAKMKQLKLGIYDFK